MTLSPGDLPAVLAAFIEVAREAGTLAMASFREGQTTRAAVHLKQGGSPVTDADLAVDRLVSDRLRGRLPTAGWLSEETADSPERLGCHHVIVVDPIDGTRAFASGLTSWAVSIALVSGDRPVAGVVYAPAIDRLYCATAGGGATCNGGTLRVADRTALSGGRLAGPDGFVAPYARHGGLEFVEKVPSLACRFVFLAEGRFDVAMSSANAHDWDMAGADLILAEAGGLLTAGDGTKLAYNRAVPRHPPLFGSSVALHPQVLDLVRRTPRG